MFISEATGQGADPVSWGLLDLRGNPDGKNAHTTQGPVW